jgi:hypothetical protein
LSLSPAALYGQQTQQSERGSFFEALASEFSVQDVAVVDAQSFAETLQESLGWVMTPDEVEDLIGSAFRFGRLDLFLSCEADAPCVMAAPGAHIALVGVLSENETEQVTLRLDRTGGQDRDPWRRFEFVTLQRSGGEWRVVARRVVGEGHQ